MIKNQDKKEIIQLQKNTNNESLHTELDGSNNTEEEMGEHKNKTKMNEIDEKINQINKIPDEIICKIEKNKDEMQKLDKKVEHCDANNEVNFVHNFEMQKQIIEINEYRNQANNIYTKNKILSHIGNALKILNNTIKTYFTLNDGYNQEIMKKIDKEMKIIEQAYIEHTVNTHIEQRTHIEQKAKTQNDTPKQSRNQKCV